MTNATKLHILSPMKIELTKNTPARQAVANFLLSSKNPVDIESIISFLRSKNLNTNKVTVYRIIDFLYKNGYIERIELKEGKFRYEIKRNHHHHLICTHCGEIEDVEGDFVSKMEKDIKDKNGFFVKSHSLEFFGICKNCLS